MKIKLTKSTIIDKKDYSAGSVVEVDEATAKFLININKAVIFKEKRTKKQG